MANKDGYACQVEAIHLDRVETAREGLPPEDQVDQAARLLKALGAPTRMRLLHALRAGELCVCDLSHLLGMSISSVSHQLRTLRELQLVRPRREGKVVFYSLKDAHVSELLDTVLDHIQE